MREFSLFVLLSLPAIVFSEYFRVCYVTNWAQYRKGTAQYIIKDHYESGLCTHLLFAFAKIEEDGDGNYVLANFEPNDFTVGYPQVSTSYPYSFAFYQTRISFSSFSIFFPPKKTHSLSINLLFFYPFFKGKIF